MVDADTGAPIPGISDIGLRFDNPHYTLPSGTFSISSGRVGPNGTIMELGIRTDKDGHLRQRLQPTKLSLLVETPPTGYVKQQDAEAQSPELHEGQTAVVTLKLHHGCTVTGEVTDDAGNPVAGVDFDLRMQADRDGGPVRNDTQIQCTTTDEHGRFTVAGLPAGQGKVQLHKYYQMPSEWLQDEPLAITVPATAPIKVTLHRGFTVTGKVTDGAGNPAAGVDFAITMPAASTGEQPDQSKYIWLYHRCAWRIQGQWLTRGPWRSAVENFQG